MRIRSIFVGAALAAASTLGLAATANAVETVYFIPGTYALAESDLGPAVDTLVVSVSGGVASFDLSGEDTATFSVPDASTPSGGGADPYYAIANYTISASWDTTAYPYLTFYSTSSGGGLTAGSAPGDTGTNYFNLFQSTVGTGQVFYAAGIPEPATWAIMLVGFGGLGMAIRSARKARGALAHG